MRIVLNQFLDDFLFGIINTLFLSNSSEKNDIFESIFFEANIRIRRESLTVNNKSSFRFERIFVEIHNMDIFAEVIGMFTH